MNIQATTIPWSWTSHCIALAPSGDLEQEGGFEFETLTPASSIVEATEKLVSDGHIQRVLYMEGSGKVTAFQALNF